MIHDNELPPPVASSLNFLQRNWVRVLVLLGVLGLTSIGGLIALVVWLVTGSIKSTDAYRSGVALAAADPVVRARLGEPVEPGWWVTGNIQTSGTSGTTDMAIPISGSTGKATIYLDAHKDLGQWQLDHVVVEFKDSRERRDVLPVQ